MKVYAIHYKLKTKEHSLINTYINVHHDLEDALVAAKEWASRTDGYIEYSFEEIHKNSISIQDVFRLVKRLTPEAQQEEKVVEKIKNSSSFDHLIKEL